MTDDITFVGLDVSPISVGIAPGDPREAVRYFGTIVYRPTALYSLCKKRRGTARVFTSAMRLARSAIPCIAGFFVMEVPPVLGWRADPCPGGNRRTSGCTSYLPSKSRTSDS